MHQNSNMYHKIGTWWLIDTIVFSPTCPSITSIFTWIFQLNLYNGYCLRKLYPILIHGVALVFYVFPFQYCWGREVGTSWTSSGFVRGQPRRISFYHRFSKEDQKKCKMQFWPPTRRLKYYTSQLIKCILEQGQNLLHVSISTTKRTILSMVDQPLQEKNFR